MNQNAYPSDCNLVRDGPHCCPSFWNDLPGDMQFALQSVGKLQKVAGFNFDDRLHHPMATGILHCKRSLPCGHPFRYISLHDSYELPRCLVGGKARANVYFPAC